MMPYDDLTSEELMPLVASGDKRAFSSLMARHRNTVYGIAYRFFKTPQEAEDVFQEVFLRVWRSAGKYQPTAQFSTWLYTVTANQCKSELASLWRRKVRLIGSFWAGDAGERIAPTTPSSEETAAQNQQAEQVRSSIGTLPAKQRLALILSRFEGLSYEEIAAVMDCSIPTVESLLFRAKNGLKKYLSNNL
ncbi:MAG: RNA polymerase sigma factor [Deltaproteobacteria bacterium]|jgi:RNA polymerase sigma-70 factor (ECF subfamily)|nr:RNA polymerase sigma factor [Deltaproteobacteria bacterium]